MAVEPLLPLLAAPMAGHGRHRALGSGTWLLHAFSTARSGYSKSTTDSSTPTAVGASLRGGTARIAATCRAWAIKQAQCPVACRASRARALSGRAMPGRADTLLIFGSECVIPLSVASPRHQPPPSGMCLTYVCYCSPALNPSAPHDPSHVRLARPLHHISVPPHITSSRHLGPRALNMPSSRVFP